ncbi:MAG: hypothetical protein U9O20_01245 [Patescibacteria group bacterium]|nr:hypothetical protein [Patescibacteria group bacterium]
MDQEQEYYSQLVRNRNLHRMEFAKEMASDFSAEKEAQNKKYGNYADTARTMRRVAAGSKIRAPIEAVNLGFKLRHELKQGEGSALKLALFFATVIDFIDIIPVAGWLVTLFFKPILFIMLWGYGTWKLKLLRAVLLMFDCIPLVNKIPMSVASVVYTYHVINKRKKEARKELDELQKVFDV